jgi:crotonobetainyl-CoA:carnitine CoA-transferase CaiB-like acyl-CoA transferase
MSGAVPSRTGNRGRGVVQGVYPTRDDDSWVALSLRDDADWSRFVDAIDQPAQLGDLRLTSQAARLAAHDEIDAVVSEWTRTHGADDIVKMLDGVVPVARVLTPDRMYGEPQLEARDYYQQFEHPVTGLHRYPGWPFRISPGPPQHHRSVAPTLGQHNSEVLTERLGLSTGEIEQLRADEVIGERARYA